MLSISYTEWRNSNSYRRYPFIDNTTLVSLDGRQLANDVFVDAMFFPINTRGQVYLQTFSLSQKRIDIWDSTGLICSCNINQNSDIQNFYDSRGRHIGVMICGPGFSNVACDMEFKASAAGLTSSCVSPQNYVCVRSLTLPDGVRCASDITFEGENGLEIITEYLDGVPVLRFDATGKVPIPDCIPPPVKCIKTSQTGIGGALMIDQLDNKIYLDTAYTLQELCTANKARLTSPAGDACDEPVPPPPCDKPQPHETPCSETSYKDYYILAAGDTIGIVPIVIQASVASQLPTGSDTDLPARDKTGLRLYLKGVTAP